MDDELFDWDSANIGHLGEHEVVPEEAEEAILGEPLDVGFDVVNGEERWSYLGETGEARVLRVVVTMRGERIRVVTAFEPATYQKNFYWKWKAGVQ
jgi:uncharacterized DUF497 family protein